MTASDRKHPRNLWQSQFSPGVRGDDRQGGAEEYEHRSTRQGSPGHEDARERIPPRHSERAPTYTHGAEHRCLEFCPICRLADVLRATTPPELQGQFAAWQREALLAVRALLDYYLERLERNENPSVVEDIPIA